ncbi:hypothetical protein [Leptospira idonii]|uniref:DoxX family protein n=1 Tax=Leptospira idonii TaxID=1193500 RepID=A0A4R9LZ40_9LEPT|nr:hypothetical protein [Leptospira idonii]TGN18745.1 hypothetical protein EHS15_15360 [Leptospira idonii]
MSEDWKKKLSLAFKFFPAVILIGSAIAKFVGNETVVASLTQAGYGPYIRTVAFFELMFVLLFLSPKTYKLGFLFLCSYLGGAAAIEIAERVFPISFFLIASLWISVFLRNKRIFLTRRSRKV